jgi:hypothetical protein
MNKKQKIKLQKAIDKMMERPFEIGDKVICIRASDWWGSKGHITTVLRRGASYPDEIWVEDNISGFYTYGVCQDISQYRLYYE